MSQIAKLFDGTGLKDVEKLTGDVGGAVPADAAFNINLLTGSGLTSTGVPATNTITFTLDGYTVGAGQTIGAVTTNVITIPMGAVAGTMMVEAKVIGFEATNPAGCGFNILASARTTGAAATLTGAIDKFVAEENALLGADANVVVAGNNIIVQVLGVAAMTINWKADIKTLGV